MPNPTKPFWQSKTIWLNVAAAVVVIFSEYQNPAHIAQALAVVNLVLRYFTTTPITVSPR